MQSAQQSRATHPAEVIHVLQSFLDHLGFTSSHKHSSSCLLPGNPNCCRSFVNSTVSCTLGLGHVLPALSLCKPWPLHAIPTRSRFA
jgi:hypothetical protein